MEGMEVVSLIVQILQFLTCVRKRGYALGTEMKQENLVRGSAEKRQEKAKIKGSSSLDVGRDPKSLVYRFWLLNCNQR